MVGCKNENNRRALIVAWLLGLITLALYWPTVHFEFNNFDDVQYITGNVRIQSGLTPGNAVWALSHSYAANWHPLTWWSHMLDWQMFGANAGGHHLINILLHVADTVLLFWVLLIMTDGTKISDSNNDSTVWPCAVVAALFAWHPMHVESVAWVAERKDVLSCFFFMLTLGAYVRYAQKTTNYVYYILSLIFFALGLMSKSMLVTVPMLLLLLDYWPFKRIQFSNAKTLFSTTLEKLPFFLLSAGTGLVAIYTQRAGGAMAAGELTIGWRVGNALISGGAYMEKLLWPHNLAVFYPARVTLPFGPMMFGLLLLLGISVFVWLRRHRQPAALVGWIWFVLTLLPVSGLLQAGEQAMADRYIYIPSIGLFLFIVWEVFDYSVRHPQGRWLAAIGAGIILAGCLFATRVQLSYWRNSATLFTHAIAVTENNALAHCKFAQDFQARGQTEEARGQFNESLRIKPGYPEALAGLGVLELENGKLDAASARLEDALKNLPSLAMAHYNLGLVRFQQKKWQEAAEHFRAAAQLQTGYDKALANLGLTLAAQGKTNEAMASFFAAIEIAPRNSYAQNGLATLLVDRGDFAGAEPHLAAAIAANPNLVGAHRTYGDVLLHRGAPDEAARQYLEELRLQPDDPYAHFNLANILAGQKKWEEAISHYTETTRIQPDFPDGWIKLGVAQAVAGKTNEAVIALEHALKLEPNSATARKALAAIQGK